MKSRLAPMKSRLHNARSLKIATLESTIPTCKNFCTTKRVQAIFYLEELFVDAEVLF